MGKIYAFSNFTLYEITNSALGIGICSTLVSIADILSAEYKHAGRYRALDFEEDRDKNYNQFPILHV